jgi:hypothetical protein
MYFPENLQGSSFKSSQLNSRTFPRMLYASDPLMTESSLEFKFFDRLGAGIIVHVIPYTSAENNIFGILKITLNLQNLTDVNSSSLDSDEIQISNSYVGFVLVKFGTYLGRWQSVLSPLIRDYLLPVIMRLKSCGNVAVNTVDIGRRALIASQGEYNTLAVSSASLQSEISCTDIRKTSVQDAVVAMNFSRLLIKNLINMACETGSIDILSTAMNRAAEETVEFLVKDFSTSHTIRICSVIPYILEDNCVFGTDILRQVLISGQVNPYFSVFFLYIYS